jgi:hypothetical protein
VAVSGISNASAENLTNHAAEDTINTNITISSKFEA